MQRKITIMMATLTLALPMPMLSAAAQEIDNPITWSLTTSAQPRSFKPGDKITVILTAKIEEGWHLYSPDQQPGGPIPTRIVVPADQPFKLAEPIDLPVPRTEIDPNFNLETQFYEDEATFSLPIVIAADAPAGKQEVRVNVSFQTCNGEKCLPPKHLKLTAEISIAAAEQSHQAATAQAPLTQSASADAQKTGITVGAQVPDFAFTDFDDKPRKFSEFRGKYVLLDFWATWCGPCLGDIPHLKELHEKYQTRGFEILGMDSETLGQDPENAQEAKETQARARKVAAAKGATWIHANDRTAVPVAVKTFGVESLPTKILIDPQGKIIARIKQGAELDQLLSSLLGGK